MIAMNKPQSTLSTTCGTKLIGRGACVVILTSLALLPAARAQGPAAKDNAASARPHQVTVGQSKIHYLAAGPEDGPPVVLLHGGRFNAHTWQETKTLEALARAGFRALAIDLPGYGLSPRSEVKPETLLAQLLPKLSAGKAVLVSPSMSGRFSLPLLTAAPDTLAGFVAVAPVGILAHKDQLHKVTTPTLLIWGEKDRVVPLAHADVLANGIAGAQKVIIKNARHPCYLDAPEEFNGALLDFLNELRDHPKNKPEASEE